MPLIDSSAAEIEAFDTVCRRLGGFDPRLDAEWFDGYLTALVAGPRAVTLDEVLERLGGDAFERAFADPEDVAMARQAMQARLRVLANHLDPEALLDQPEALRLQPLVQEWSDDDRQQLAQEPDASPDELALLRTGAVWAIGFSAAMDDFASELELPADAAPPAAQTFEELLFQVHALMLPEDSEALQEHLAQGWKDRLPTREDLLDEACFAIQDLRLWWLDHAPRPSTRRVPAQPGRNDACPCGSGLKYKKCHGKPA